jgi:adenine-specific DNA-methyltransferase
VSALAKRFHSNKQHYFSDKYKEVDARTDFIDKLFHALGWRRSDDPFRQEMKIEQGSKATKGRADYAFSIGPHYSRVRFYVEAKRPQPSISTPDNCFQAIRYSWPREIPITVLTDFCSIHVLDCRFRPSIDSATRRIVRTWKYSDLEDKKDFTEPYWLFSREAIESGSIENFAANELPASQVATKQYSLSLGEVRDFDEDFL